MAGGDGPAAGAIGDRQSGPSRREIGVLAIITCAALAARFWRLGDLPGGLHVDEAYNLLDARAVLAGWRPIFLPANAGRDVLFTYLQAPLVAWLGETALAARTAAAIAGTAAVPATWWMTRTLAVGWQWGAQNDPRQWRPSRWAARATASDGRTAWWPDPGRVALASAVLMAFTFWPLHFSRYGIRAVLFVPIVALAATAWGRLSLPPIPRRPHAWAVALGILLAAAAYAHPAGRGLVVLPAVYALVIWVRCRWTFPARALLVAGVVAVLLAAPLLVNWQRHPEQFASHAAEVSVVQSGPTVIATNAVRVAAMFNFGGDPAPWRNVTTTGKVDDPGSLVAAGRPVFDPVTGLLFVLGVVVTAACALRGVDAAWLIGIWAAGLLLPSVLTDAAPNWSRAIGALPFVVMAPALAADAVARMLPKRIGSALWVVWLVAAGAWTLQVYFVDYAPSATTALAFDADKVALGRAAREEAAPPRTCVVLVDPEMARHPTVEIAAGQDLRAFTVAATRAPGGTAEPSVNPPFWGEPGQCVVALWRNAGAVERREVASPDVNTLWRPAGGGGPLATVLFGGALELVGSRVSDLGQWPVSVELAWRVRDRVPEAHSMFVHARDSEGVNVVQWDGPPLGDVVMPEELRPGEQFVTTTILDDPGSGGQPAAVIVGWYDWRDGARLQVEGPPPGLDTDDGTAFRLADDG